MALFARLALCYCEVFGEPLGRVMKLPEAEFHQLCLSKVLAAFNPAKDHYFSVDEARPLAEYLGVDPVESWTPTAELLKECTAAEVVAVGEALEITAEAQLLPAKIIAAFP